MAALLVAAALGACFSGCLGGGALGLADFQRDLLVGAAGALAGALLNAAFPDPAGDGLTVRTMPGPAGPEGPPGPTLFSVFQDRFFGAQFVDGGFRIVPVPKDAATIAREGGPVGFRLLIPSVYGSGDTGQMDAAQGAHPRLPVTLRLFLRRLGACGGGCFVLTVDARRLRSGDREPQCFGGVAEDCSDGRRWVLVEPACADGEATRDLFLNVDLPLGPEGLQFPELEAGDYLAFELNLHADDGGAYRLFGVELYDSLTAQLNNATVFLSPEGIPTNCGGGPAQPPPDCNGNGLPDSLDIASGSSADCNANGVPDECDIGSGASRDVDRNGVPDECERDCNGNGVPDALDIANGTSQDCNRNHVPDECDIASGTSPDANGNGVPDECEDDCNGNGVPDALDIASGASADCNRNGVPDECEEGNHPPDCGDGAGRELVLWPPNHRMAAIDLPAEAGVTDPDGDPIQIVVTSITQDEPVNELGDGNTAPDGAGVGTATALVRVERSGRGNGRAYHIHFTATDGRGGSCDGVFIVRVPHNPNRDALDEGELYDSTVAPP